MNAMCQCGLVLPRMCALSLTVKACISSLSSSVISSRTLFKFSRIQAREFKSQHFNGTQSFPSYLSMSDAIEPEEQDILCEDMAVLEEFLSEREESALFNEVEPHMKRLRYEFDHWDDAIHGFRETEKLQWTQPCSSILDRVRSVAFQTGKSQLRHVHVLDLSENGYIKPHIDSVRFCGDTIAGLSLLSDSVMRLVHEKDKLKIVDILLKRRSLYVMRNSARYDYTHEVLSKDNSLFKGILVPRSRRISVICRSEVSQQ